MNRANLAFWVNQITGTLTFMIGVVACYFGALQQMPWLGMAVVLLIILIDLLQDKKLIRKKIKLVVLVTLAAAVMETLLIVASVYSVNPSSRLLDFQFLLPIWILALWVNFSVRIISYLVFTRGKHFVNALLGIVFAVLIFRSAERFGLVELTYGIYSLAIIAVAWGHFCTLHLYVCEQFIPGHKKK